MTRINSTDNRWQVVATNETGGLESAGYVTPIQPRHAHDCTSCVFLGQLGEYDLYYCPQGTNPTVLARWDSEPSHYQSGWGSCLTPLVVAECYARRKGWGKKEWPKYNVIRWPNK